MSASDKKPLDIGFNESLTKVSQMLSNFKLFSKTRQILPIQPEPLNLFYYNYKYAVVAAFVIIVCIFAYLQREYIFSMDVYSLVEKLWLNTHLTSTGELASTYVPGDFSEYVSSLVASSSSE